MRNPERVRRDNAKQYARTAICIGGPFHGQSWCKQRANFLVVGSQPFNDQQRWRYIHMCNEFGEWWVVE